MITNKLTQQLLEKIQNGENIGISDLYAFSKVRLKRNKMRKKFHKYYYRYISKDIYDIFFGCLISYPLVNSFINKKDILTIEPMIPNPDCKISYIDYQYNPDSNV
jgi:hypothetical protein